jgi:hypothetical protein
MKPEPHHAHLAEMRASQPDATAMDEFRVIVAAVPCRALTGATLQAARTRYAADREADRLRQCYPDPTRRHLAEMEMSILEQRHADGLIDAREVNARHPDGARRLLAVARKEGRRG